MRKNIVIKIITVVILLSCEIVVFAAINHTNTNKPKESKKSAYVTPVQIDTLRYRPPHTKSKQFTPLNHKR